MLFSTELSQFIGAMGTICIFSFLYKENGFYRFFEYAVVGMAAAHSAVQNWHNYVKPFTLDRVIGGGEWIFIIPGILGLLYYTRFLGPEYSWLSRYPVSVAVGYSIGNELIVGPRSQLVQIAATFQDFSSINNYIFLGVFVCVVMYFMFTVSNKTKIGAAVMGMGKVGRYAMMVYYGVSFGNTVQGRMSLLLGRILFLFGDWLGLVQIGSEAA